MLERLLHFLFGYCRVKVQAEKADVMNALFDCGLSYWNIRHTKDGLCFCFLRRDRKKVADLLDKIPDAGYIIYDRGLIAIAYRYRARPGVILGALVFLLSLWFSTQFIWDVRITGNETLPSSYIRECLASLGCKTGAYYPALDLYELSTRYLQLHDDLCWISVNMKGNVACVEVRETEQKPSEESDTAPANVLASKSGVVTAVYVYEGDAAVKIGDSVTEGQLLISGFSQDRYEAIRLVRARGEVWAQTVHTVTVEVPYADVRREYTDRSVSYRTARFFGISFPLFFGGIEEPPMSECIESEDTLTFFSVVRTPILIQQTEYFTYREVSFLRTPAQAHAEALRCMEEEMLGRFANAEILKIDSYTYDAKNQSGQDCFVLRYEITCVEDIAYQKEIQTEKRR